MKLTYLIIPLFIFSHLSHACFESSIMSPTPFMGNNGEIFKLADGTIWEVKYEYEYMYEYYPTVTVCPDKGFMIVGDTKLDVVQVSNTSSNSNTSSSDLIESNIDGDFEGFEGDTIIKLMNGQVWQQIDATYKYTYSYMPKVLIYQNGSIYYMSVEGVDKKVMVERLK